MVVRGAFGVLTLARPVGTRKPRVVAASYHLEQTHTIEDRIVQSPHV